MEKLNIPKNVHVGFQNREDTYTGKLAFLIYTDEKGVKRKETSWNGWRDRKIDPEDYENVPMTGFVLNRNGGGARNYYHWNPRNEFIRVYDPRGFEFEISLPNLLFILTKCNSIKGKGLEGEFIYAWDRTELVLLPVNSQEYEKSLEFTALQSKKVTKNDMIEGHTYMDKNGDRLVYLGRRLYQDESYYRLKFKHIKQFLDGGKKGHIFYNLDSKYSKIHYERGFTKLREKITDVVYPEYDKIYDEFVKAQKFYKFKELKLSKKSTSGYYPYHKLLVAEINETGEYFFIEKYRHWNDEHYNVLGSFCIEEFKKGNIKFTPVNDYRESKKLSFSKIYSPYYVDQNNEEKELYIYQEDLE